MPRCAHLRQDVRTRPWLPADQRTPTPKEAWHSAQSELRPVAHNHRLALAPAHRCPLAKKSVATVRLADLGVKISRNVPSGPWRGPMDRRRWQSTDAKVPSTASRFILTCRSARPSCPVDAISWQSSCRRAALQTRALKSAVNRRRVVIVIGRVPLSGGIQAPVQFPETIKLHWNEFLSHTDRGHQFEASRWYKLVAVRQ